MASNFLALGTAEILCRGISVLVTLTLAQRLGTAGYGRIEFAFNVVFWLVLIVRDCLETIVTREIARHPRLTRALVGHVLAAKLVLASLLLLGALAGGFAAFRERGDVLLLGAYGLLLLTTALGIDFVYRGTERMGIVALSLCVRALVYSAGVWFTVADASRIVLVPLWLASGEAVGIGLVWVAFSRRFGVARPVFHPRFLKVFLRRGRSVVLVQLSQAVLISADLMVVGVLLPWSDVGTYGAPHRMVAALLAFGLIFQQVVFPVLSRCWRQEPGSVRGVLDRAARLLLLGFLPIVVGGMVLSEPLVHAVLPGDYRGAGRLLAIGIWRAPLLSLAFLYQSALIAMNRETAGLRLLLGGAAISGPCVGVLLAGFGLPGACVAVVAIGGTLVAAGYACLAREGEAPAWHHHVATPLAGVLVMVPVCLAVARLNLAAGIAAGALAYACVVYPLGGFRDLALTRSGPASTRWPMGSRRAESSHVARLGG